MKNIGRRDVLKLFAGGMALAAAPFARKANAFTPPPRVVVVGGGFAGATAAKYLRKWGGNIQVTLVDSTPAHVSCIGSNLVLNGMHEISELTMSYDTLKGVYGVQVLTDTAAQVDPVARRVQLASGGVLDYDRLVLAPGIDFEPPAGWDPNVTPHAWKAGPQTLLLKQQLAALTAGGTFVLTIPPAPYRCPMGPYERVCVVAAYLKKYKPGSRVQVLDANPGIVAAKSTFTVAFDQTYAGIVEYVPNVTVSAVDPLGMVLTTSIGDVAGSVINLIPRQRAGKIVFDTGLVPAGQRFAPVDPLTYESTLVPGVHIIGDAQGTAQAKAGQVANAEAKVCADAIVRIFDGLAPSPAPKTTSACYSAITSEKASWLTTVYGYDALTRTMKAQSSGESPAPTADHFQRMFAWQSNLLHDTFA